MPRKPTIRNASVAHEPLPIENATRPKDKKLRFPLAPHVDQNTGINSARSPSLSYLEQAEKYVSYAKHNLLPTINHLVIFIFTANSISALISTVIESLTLTSPWRHSTYDYNNTRNSISNNWLAANTWPQILILYTLRIVQSAVALNMNLTPFASAAMLTYARLPYSVFVYLCSELPVMQTILSVGGSAVADYLAAHATAAIASAKEPQPFVVKEQTGVQKMKAAAQTNAADLRQWVFLDNREYPSGAVLGLFAVLLLALPLSGLGMFGVLQPFVVRSFYPLPSVERIYDLTLLKAVMITLPAFGIPWFLLSRPAVAHQQIVIEHAKDANETIKELKNIKATWPPSSTEARTLLLAVVTAVDVGTRLAVSVSGASAWGVLSVAFGWAVATATAGCAMMWVEWRTDVSPSF